MLDDLPPEYPEGFRLVNGNYYRAGSRAGPYFLDENGRAHRLALSIAPSEVFRLTQSEASANPTLVHSGETELLYISGFNRQASARLLLLYDLDRAPIAGQDTPVWMEYLEAGEKFTLDFTAAPMPFLSGLAFAFMSGQPDNAQAVVEAGDILAFNLAYAG